MKKVICIILVVMMVLATGAWTSVRAVDNSELIEYLEDEGFTRRGDVWTNEIRNEDDVIFATMWFDVVENRGLMTLYYAIDDNSYVAGYRVGIYVITWDYEESDLVILESEEYTR